MCVSDPGRETLLRCSVIVCCTWYLRFQQRHYLRFQQRDTISGSSREALLPLSCGIVLWYLWFQQRDTISDPRRNTTRFQQRDTRLQSAVVSPVPAERHYVTECCGITGPRRETLYPSYLRLQQRDTTLHRISGSSRETLHHVVSPVPAERHHFRSQKKHYTIVCCSVSGPSRETLQYSVR